MIGEFTKAKAWEDEYPQLLGNEQTTPSPHGWTAILYGKSESVTNLDTWKSEERQFMHKFKMLSQKLGTKGTYGKL